MSQKRDHGSILGELKAHSLILGLFVGLMWVVQLINWMLPKLRLTQYGIHPRNFNQIEGIVLSPFLHGNWNHLIANTTGLLIFGWLILIQDIKHFFMVTGISALSSGILVWLISPSRSVTIGASGIVFGYLGFLMVRGFFERSFVSIFLSVTVMFFYGGMLFGVLPSDNMVSWQAHLGGAIGGIMTAAMLGPKSKLNT